MNQGESMKQKSIIPGLLAGLGGALAAAALTVCLTQRDAEPIILSYPQGAEDCVGAMMTALCSGDYSGASQYLYGQPDLGSGVSGDSETAAQLWSSFTSSLQYTADAPCTASDSGVSQQVTITSLDMNQVLEEMAAEAPELLERKIALLDIADMDEVYDANHEYQPGFVDSVLYQAAGLALADAQTTQHTVTVNLLYDAHQWWVMPDAALLNAISGGILQ